MDPEGGEHSESLSGNVKILMTPLLHLLGLLERLDVN